MCNLVEIGSPGEVSTSEATWAAARMVGHNLVIPYYNVLALENSALANANGRYVRFSYLLFFKVESITRDYDLSRTMEPKNRECFGGNYFGSLEHHEFWIKYERGKILVPKNYETSHLPWPSISQTPETLLNVPVEVMEYITV